MIWEDITILKPVKTGTDELGNDKFNLRQSVRMKARVTAPKDVLISLDDRLMKKGENIQMSLNNRLINKNEQMFVLPTRRDLLPSIQYFEHNGQIYKVLAVETLTPRFTRIRAVTYENHDYRR